MIDSDKGLTRHSTQSSVSLVRMRFNDIASSSLFLCIYSVVFCQETSPIDPVFSSLETPSPTTRPTRAGGGETSPIDRAYSSLETPSATTRPTKAGGGDSVGCKGMVCPTERYCVERIGGASCVCYEICSNVKDPVCGSNFVTYNNECELYKESCSSIANITIIFRGNCADAKLGSTENQGAGGASHSNRLTDLLGITSLVFMRR